MHESEYNISLLSKMGVEYNAAEMIMHPRFD